MNKTKKSFLLDWVVLILFILSLIFPSVWDRWGILFCSAAQTPQEAVIKIEGRDTTINQCLEQNGLAWVRYNVNKGRGEYIAEYNFFDQTWRIIPKALMHANEEKISHGTLSIYTFHDKAVIGYRAKATNVDIADSQDSKFFYAQDLIYNYWWAFFPEIPTSYSITIKGVSYEIDFDVEVQQ